jgi:putative pyruvate formate lyase activating enzyme
MIPRTDFEPAYSILERRGELEERVRWLKSVYTACRLCPRQCGANRTRGESGVCALPARVRFFSAHPHFGEERSLVGRGGSGTIFFSRCNLLCVFCQNWEINHRGDGVWMSDAELAAQMLALQEQGCHNINLVTPTHLAPSIVAATRIALQRGLRLPLVWNCGGYENIEIIRALEGIVDIYLPDFKFMDGEIAARLTAGAGDYPERAAECILEMHRQVGNLVLDENGRALRGLIVRHLVLPHNLASTDRFVAWSAKYLGPDAAVNIMGQYRPEHRAREFPELAQRLASADYQSALRLAEEAGLRSTDGS